MRTIRASEISTYLFCQRAWKYAQNGIEPKNQAEMAAGSDLHYRHGRAAMAVGCLRILAYALLLSALALLAAYFTRTLL
jgi:hypothetical protein